jgi:hypothetical protein
LDDQSRLETVSVETLVFRRAHTIVRLDSTTEGVGLLFQGKQITFPSHASEAVGFVAQHEQFRVVELPNVLDDEGKLVLVKRLIREGLLTIAEESGVS